MAYKCPENTSKERKAMFIWMKMEIRKLSLKFMNN